MRVRFHHATGLAHGHAASLLRVIGVSAISLNEADGSCDADVSDSQLAMFQLRGGSHRVEPLPESQEDVLVLPVAAPVVDLSKPVQGIKRDNKGNLVNK